jgi:Tn3 transposase DDE domain
MTRARGAGASTLREPADALAARGAAVPPELVRRVAPLGWEHIGLTGDYVWAADWAADAQPGPGPLRPLRERPSPLAA